MGGFLVGKKKMSKCQNCKHDCHCQNNLHEDDAGICECNDCQCNRQDVDKTWENEVEYDK